MPTATETTEKLALYAIELNDFGAAEGKLAYVRLPPPTDRPYRLRFRLTAGSAASVRATLKTNYPVTGPHFHRNTWHAVKFTVQPCYNTHCDLVIERPGAFEYYVESQVTEEGYESGREDGRYRKESRIGYFVVEPKLHPRRCVEPIPLDGIALISVIPKLLGPISTWKPRIKAIADRGYNMIHYIPLQERGVSNSPYSIYNQLTFSNDLFESDMKDNEHAKNAAMAKMLQEVEEYGILGLSDVVWNHTACNSKWLQEHPEAGYNLENAPHLTAAYELDEAILKFSEEINVYGISNVINSMENLDAIMKVLEENVIPSLKLWEFYVIDVRTSVEELSAYIDENGLRDPQKYCVDEIRNMSVKDRVALIVKDALRYEKPGMRYGMKLVNATALDLVLALIGQTVHDTKDLKAMKDVVPKAYEKLLNDVNQPFYEAYDDDLKAICENIRGRVKYTRLDAHGPRLGSISKEVPLLESYFTRLPKNEITSKHHIGALVLANNGWIWNANPLTDFASAKSRAYLRREVIIWGDCVKLRYGKRKEDNPWIWDHMERYTNMMASMFHGFRIDNCHSTPIHVAQHFLDSARRVRPDLYVVAELFTGSEEMDIVYVSRLGINSLIREAMQAWDSNELSRLVHRYGGKPIGSLDSVSEPPFTKSGMPSNLAPGQPYQIIPLSGATPHALFMDCTHDNETPHQKRTAEDTLPTASLVAMASCATGSVQGYDDVYPTLIDLVNETRLYEVVSRDNGIGKARKFLNELHAKMSRENYSEIYVHHESQFVVVHRFHPELHDGYMVIARTAFKGASGDVRLTPMKLRSTKVEVLLSVALEIGPDRNPVQKDVLKGMETRLVTLEPPFTEYKHDSEGWFTEVSIKAHFPPGSIIVLKTSLNVDTKNLRDKLLKGVEQALTGVGWEELNVAIFRTDAEERDMTGNHGTYVIPGHGALAFCGLQGFQSALQPLLKDNDLGNPICAHLREGRWATEYCVARLDRYMEVYPKIRLWRDYLSKNMNIVRSLPNFMVPKYFAAAITVAYRAACQHAILVLMSDFVRDGDEFTYKAALTAVQMFGRVKSTSLHPTRQGPCLAAGLPHFSTAHMRCWGRDVFVSLRGLLMLTGNWGAAREHLAAFAGVLKHGLIPNLLDSARRPRYNSRDATWFFLQSVQDYCLMSPEGEKFLLACVPRRFPGPDEYCEANDQRAYSRTSSVAEIIQEILQRHAEGISFREHNAGPNLDHAMRDPGFQVDVFVDWTTGFIHGGNGWNCGTWMDKMGDSERAGTKGVPASPRDGAAVEIQGLLKSTLRWLCELNRHNKFPFKSVRMKDGRCVTFKEWNDLLQRNFERCFYVPEDPSYDKDHDVAKELVNRRGVYKDTYRSDKPYHDYQFRPNFAITMVAAPELFVPAHALHTLGLSWDVLAGPLGIRTLDPGDWEYRANYDNSNDSNDPSIARGQNYHQGPEWLWVMGYFLRAVAYFQSAFCKEKTEVVAVIHRIQRRLIGHRKLIETSPWAGLPELTNKDGAFCADSCPSQAWSTSTLLELMDDMTRLYDTNFEAKGNHPTLTPG